MYVFKKVFYPVVTFAVTAFLLSGCYKSDIDAVKDGFFSQDKTQKIGKFLETYKNVSNGKWQTVKDNRSRDVVVFSGTYSNKALAGDYLTGNYPELAKDYTDKFASFLDKNKFSLSFAVDFLMAADKSGSEPFVINALGLSSNAVADASQQNIDAGIGAVIANSSFDSLISKEDVRSLNYYFQKFVAEEVLLTNNKTAQAVVLEYEFDWANLPGMLFSSIKDGSDSLSDYYPIERVVIDTVKSDDLAKSINYTVSAQLTDAYFEALYGKDVGRPGAQSLDLDCEKFDALNANYRILQQKELSFVQTVNAPEQDFILVSQSAVANNFNMSNGSDKLSLALGKDGVSFSCVTSYHENDALKNFKKQQELLYRVDNEVKLSLLQNAFIGAFTGKKLSDKEMHDEMVKGREKIYKEQGWTLPPALFMSASADVI